MRLSQSLFKTFRSDPKDESAANAKLLVKAGFINKLMAGVYSFLPLGFRVLQKIGGVIREEMNALGGEEILLPVLHPKENWEITGRWNALDILYKIKGKDEKEMALGPTHEEVIVPLVKNFVSSYKNLPLRLYQIQDKFRDELRAKSGLLRGKEFLMKDLYSFHADAKDLDGFYEKIKKSYFKIFKRIGLNPILTEASGGTFAKYSHEFQVLAEAGEDLICHCACGFARNAEICESEKKTCPDCGKETRKSPGIEVGNIFKLDTKYSEPFNLVYKNKAGGDSAVLMGCYGIGLGRAMGTVVETSHDAKGIVWPENIAPFKFHLLSIGEENKVKTSADKVYQAFLKAGAEVFYDDRESVSAGEKFIDADLMGMPWRLVVSAKTAKQDKIEVKKRNSDEIQLLPIHRIIV